MHYCGILNQQRGASSESHEHRGRNVELRDPVGTRKGGKTLDLFVDGVAYNVYTPVSYNPSSIASTTAKKNSQASGIALDLSNTSVTQSQLVSILKNQGTGASTIKDIQIIKENMAFGDKRI